MSVTLREITKDTVRDVIRLSVAPEQQRFVAPNAVSLAQALFHPEAWYRAVYADDTLVGFVMLHDESRTSPPPAKPRLTLWRLMVDERHQRRGVGREILARVFEHARSRGGFTELYTSVRGCARRARALLSLAGLRAERRGGRGRDRHRGAARTRREGDMKAPAPAVPVALRRLGASDLPWINARYAGIAFAPSTEHDLIVAAEVDGIAAGIGRLVPVGPDAAEMGGIHTLPEWRRHGIASMLVRHLVEVSPYPRLFCVPFRPLERFYGGFGFHAPPPGLAIPEAIRRKVDWCAGRYPDPVSVLVRDA